MTDPKELIEKIREVLEKEEPICDEGWMLWLNDAVEVLESQQKEIARLREALEECEKAVDNPKVDFETQRNVRRIIHDCFAQQALDKLEGE